MMPIYNMEAEELAEMMKKNQENAESKIGGKFEERSKEKPKSKDGKARKSRSPSPGDPSVPNGPSDPPDDSLTLLDNHLYSHLQ